MSTILEAVDAMKQAEEVIDKLIKQNDRLRAALRHQVHRNHEFAKTCDGCMAAFRITEGL